MPRLGSSADSGDRYDRETKNCEMERRVGQRGRSCCPLYFIRLVGVSRFGADFPLVPQGEHRIIYQFK